MDDIVVAGQEGECAVCEQPIAKGEPIVLIDGWWAHAECAGTFSELMEERGYERD